MGAIDRRYQDERYKNWLSCVNGLRALRCLLRTFLEDQTQRFHRILVDRISTKSCVNNCEISKNVKPNELPSVCELCSKWSRELLANHKAQGSPIHWSNCNPQRWPEEKWEAAKVYMPGGHKTHVKFDDFDMAALINLMSRCTHFHRLIKASGLQKLIESVTEVRNKVMHSPDFTMSAGDLKKHLEKIKRLGRVLEPHAPEMKSLSEEIDKGTGEQSLEEFKEMELLMMEEKIGFISVSFSDMPGTHSEERSQQLIVLVDSLWSFMEQHQDLQQALSIQMTQLISLKEHKEQLMEALAKVQENQKRLNQNIKKIHQYKRTILDYQKLLEKKQEELGQRNTFAIRLAIVSILLGLIAFMLCFLAMFYY
ncbi:uncharacterized protein LOC143122002 [Alosa pseudoharengus]|uniref:uncharacterized protein LOC143122002 n=1 Tax=Alosa pseudoharengus TaxID=34774 RepID=UPI003F88F0FD